MEKKKYSERGSNDIARLCCYSYSCGVNFTIFIELERLLKPYGYSYQYWCEQALFYFL